jgi:hypothetical protein
MTLSKEILPSMGLAKQFKLSCLRCCVMKDEVTNFVNMTIALKSVISCEALNLPQPFNGTYFGHAMRKAVQYATNDDKIFKDLALKFAQTSFQSCIIWPKNQVC